MTGRHQPLLGGVEAGGTKFICAIAQAPADILREIRIPTTMPDETLQAAIAFFASARHELGAIGALGIASFGPVGLRRGRADWGHILATPKPGWSNADLAGRFAEALRCPVEIDTDVNGAALAEQRYGAGRGLENLAYVTVGTGLGAGVLSRGMPIHGLVHPEIGHLRPRRHPADLDFRGICPFHGDCFEGLASGGAIAARFGAPLGDFPEDHPAWGIEADYLSQFCATLVLSCSPERIIMGGGVMQQDRLFPLIRARLGPWLGGYPDVAATNAAGQDFIVPPGLGGHAGSVGALMLAQSLLKASA